MPMRTRFFCLGAVVVAALANQASAQVTVNPADRNSVVALFNNTYLPAFANNNHGWTGSTAGCNPGTVNSQFTTDTLTAVNVFRAMAGFLNVTFGNPQSFPTSGSGLVDCQRGALMLHAANTLSHNLPASSPCWTAAGNAALATSNLTGGAVGPAGIALLVDDGNGDMGHRRWILHEPQLQMAMGSTSNFMALDVMASMAPGTRTRATAWPPAGFVPYQWAWDSWTFAVPGLNQDVFNPATHADFSAATVTVTRGGVAVPITTRIPSQCIFCYDNAIAWTFNTPIQRQAGMPDTPYVVTIGNVLNTAQSTYTYTVTVIDAVGGGGGPTADECSSAIALVNGLNGPFDSTSATNSAPAWPCGPGSKDLWFSYTASAAGSLSVSTCGQAAFDTVVEVFSGSCGALTSLGCNDDSPTCNLQSSMTVSVAPGTYRIRVGGFNNASGTFRLDVTGPQGGSPAAVASYGAGCITSSKAFYELFGTAAAFDLHNDRMSLLRSGNTYVAQSGGVFVPTPVTATVLPLSDDSFTTVTLNNPFSYPGGTTSTLEVCSNGFVSVATGNGAATNPTAAAWLASAQPRWGTWHDFDPSAVAGGKVKFHQSATVAFVTWDGVFDYNTTSPSTWQLQFDLNTGRVTYAWQTMSTQGNAFLVGYAAAAPNLDAGSRDLSATLPGTFRTQSSNSPPLALGSSLPQLGATAVLTTTQFPATAPLGMQILSTVLVDPGTDLAFLGMPGCRLSVNLDVTSVLVPVASQATASLPVPNNPALIGVQIGAQSAAFHAEANSFGVITSNGVRLTIGT